MRSVVYISVEGAAKVRQHTGGGIADTEPLSERTR